MGALRSFYLGSVHLVVLIKHGLAIQWGPVGDVGVVGDTFSGETALDGLGPQKIRSCIEVMDVLMSQGHPVVCSYVKAERSRKLCDEESKDLVQCVARILGVKDVSTLNPDISLGELGVDSLMNVEVKQTLERDYDVTLSMREVRQLTIARIKHIGEMGSEYFSSRDETGDVAVPQ